MSVLQQDDTARRYRLFALLGTYMAVAIFVISIFFPIQVLFAQVSTPSPTPTSLATDSAVSNRRAQLQAELDAIEQQIGGFQGLIDSKEKEAGSLQRDIAIINAQISQAKLEIKKHDLAVEQLADTIGEKSRMIDAMSTQIDKEKESLAESIRQLNEYDDIPLAQILLSYDHISDFFTDVDNIDSVQLAIQNSATQLRDHVDQESTAKDELEQKRDEEAKLRQLQATEKRLEEQKQHQKKQILADTKGQESEYKKIVVQKQRDASSIRTQLFMLEGSPAISFEKALEYATFSSLQTGVRPAFILGIISQETDLGRNIGQCNLATDEPKYKWDQVMATRDHDAFRQITTELGLDINSMPVSCPMKGADGKRVGWGGGMGPAQFIPSTWQLYKDQVAAIVGHSPANPWTPKDAFVASGLLLKDNGAVGGRDSEIKAAGKYFAGSNWNSYLGRSYANQVMTKVDDFQDQINFLNGTQ